MKFQFVYTAEHRNWPFDVTYPDIRL